jgi:hypothetical protein
MVTIEDSRYRLKLYLDTYITDANITVDDDTTEAYTTVMYAYPPYPMELLFSGNYEDYDIIFFVDKPISKPRYSSARLIHAYEESIPIHCHCLDKTGVTPELVLWKAEDELRRVLYTYPEQTNWRLLSESKEHNIRSASTTFYGFTLTFTYLREST